MRRAFIVWGTAFVLLTGAFIATVAILNATVYSAGGFVGNYLEALARADAETARQLPGVLGDENAATDLLSDSALVGLGDIRLVADLVGAGPVHTVTYEYTIGGQLAQTEYRVRPSGAVFGLFSAWRFDETPLATLAVAVLHDDRFRANGVDLMVQAANEPKPYLVFAPGLFVLDHESTFLEAADLIVPVVEPGGVTSAEVDVQANTAFVDQVDKELSDYLDECATQEVLMPTACPFGRGIDNRVTSTPEWSMSEYPEVEIVPGDEIGTWLMPETDAAAHLIVEVQSLFDGSVSTFDEDVPFDVEYVITFLPDDELLISAQ